MAWCIIAQKDNITVHGIIILHIEQQYKYIVAVYMLYSKYIKSNINENRVECMSMPFFQRKSKKR